MATRSSSPAGPRLSGESSQGTVFHSPKNLRILIADDHDIMRCGIRSIIEMQAEWHVVAEAADGQTAIKLAMELEPDIVIADYALPALNGLDLTARIIRELGHTQVLIYTMQDREDLALNVIRAGARGYVLKSDGGDCLVDAVSALGAGDPYFTPIVAQAVLDAFTSAPVKNAPMLSELEREVIRLVAEGRTNREISHLLDIDLKTVETRRLAAMDRLNLGGIAAIVRYAVRNNIIPA